MLLHVREYLKSIKTIRSIYNLLKKYFLTPRPKKVDWSKEDFASYKKNIENAYFQYCGKKLKLNKENTGNLKTFSEKMQWLRVYDNSPLKTQLADKYLVREWVKNKIGEEYLIPLLGAWENFDDIDFEKMPASFVLKCTHGCGYNIVVPEKSVFNIAEAKIKMDGWMEENFAHYYGEIHYSTIKPRIIAEKYIESFGGDVEEYKFFCFNGTPYFILYCFGREAGRLERAFYDLQWKRQDFHYLNETFTANAQKPSNLESLTQIAEVLGKDFKHVRVDLYNTKEQIYFGEMTFTTYGGYVRFQPSSKDEELGRLIVL